MRLIQERERKMSSPKKMKIKEFTKFIFGSNWSKIQLFDGIKILQIVKYSESKLIYNNLLIVNSICPI